jgi:hypothetical protein
MGNRPFQYGGVKVSGSRANMYVFNNSTVLPIQTSNVWHALQANVTQESSSHWTFYASANGAITDTASNGGVLRCTDVGHGRSTGDIICLTGMGDAAHNGVSVITVIDVDTFDANSISWNSDNDTGVWAIPNRFQLNTEDGEGKYIISVRASWTPERANDVFSTAIFVNETYQEDIYTTLASQGIDEPIPLSIGGPADITNGDYVWLGIMNESGTDGVIPKHGVLSIDWELSEA